MRYNAEEQELTEKFFQGGMSQTLSIKLRGKDGGGELCNSLMWKEVKNVSIIRLIEFPVAPEGGRMDSPSFPLGLSIQPCPGKRYNFINLHLIVCSAGRASHSVPEQADGRGGGR